MHKLYWRERTGAFAPAAVMAELDIPYEGIHLDKETREHEGAAYRALNPMAQIPTLILPDGQVMTESAAIALHLAETKPDSGLVPPVGDPRRPGLLRWLFFAQSNIYETDLRFTYSQRYTADPDGVEGVRQAAYGRFERLWDMVAGAIGRGPFFFGDAFTLLDIHLAMLATWHYDPPALYGRHRVVKRLVDAVTARPAIAPVWRQYGMDRK
ncbi:MAG: glutathione S-transferase family protein [Kiloniellaceae bacterium]